MQHPRLGRFEPERVRDGAARAVLRLLEDGVADGEQPSDERAGGGAPGGDRDADRREVEQIDAEPLVAKRAQGTLRRGDRGERDGGADRRRGDGTGQRGREDRGVDGDVEHAA